MPDQTPEQEYIEATVLPILQRRRDLIRKHGEQEGRKKWVEETLQERKIEDPALRCYLIEQAEEMGLI